jgi:DNA-directed RNA polymerase subunit N (RpoN/RPB10)
MKRMPKCVKCDKVLPPDLMVDVGEPVNGIIPMRCIFCDQNITKFHGNTKEEYIKDYEIFLKKLKESKNIADMIGGKTSLV